MGYVYPGVEQHARCILRLRITLLCGLLVVLQREVHGLLDALAQGVHDTQVVLRQGVAQLSAGLVVKQSLMAWGIHGCLIE